MSLEFLFGAGVGSLITGGILQKVGETKSKQIESMLQTASDYHQQGKHKEAISVLEKATELNRFDPRIYILMWGAYSQLAIKTESNTSKLSAIDKAVECHDVIQWLVSQGAFVPSEMLEELEKHNAFLKTMKDVTTGKVQIVDNKAEEFYDKAESAREAGNYREADQFLTKAIELETNDVLIAMYHVMRAYTRVMMGDCEAAMSDCRIGLKCQGIPDAHIEIAQGTLKFCQRIDREWKKDLRSQQNATKERLGDISGVCSLCGGDRDLTVEKKMTICKKCRKEWRDRKVKMVKAATGVPE